ncbi:MAG: hypothetical protein HDR09_13110 [Lachnospiraceae bacterium]|nr:hypothetical protein [Lachnospiraceae bacterium]
MKIILKNWLLLTVGLVLTAICVKVAYEERGYIAVGGEWLVIPLLATTKAILKSVVEDILNGY